MKKIYTFLLTLVFTLSAKAQVTYHFPYNNAQWGQFSGVCCFPNLTGFTSFINAGGDSSLNGKTYIKLYSTTDSAGTNFSGADYLIREDTTGRVYYFDANINSDTLLYNFNLNVGDTANVYSSLYSQDHPVVDSIRYYHIFNETRKCIFFNQHSQGGPDGNRVQPLQWIEGIGSTDGLLIPYGAQFLVDGVSWMTCFRQNDSLKYGTVCNQVYGGVGIKEESSIQGITIYPNPGTGLFHIAIAMDKKLLPGTFLIYNALGQLVQKQAATVYTSKTININRLPDDVYFVFDMEASGKITPLGKAIKQTD